MHWLDIAILAILVLAALLGARTGLIGQAARLFALGAAIYGAIRLNDRVTPLLDKALADAPSWAAQALAYAAVFLVIYATLLTITLFLERGVQAAQMQGLNRALGAVLGAAKAGLLLGLLFLALAAYLPDLCREALEKSSLAPFLSAGARKVCEAIPEEYRDNVRAQLRHLEGLSPASPQTQEGPGQ